MAHKRYAYLLQRIKGSRDWPKGCTIWANSPCTGWRVIQKMEVKN